MSIESSSSSLLSLCDDTWFEILTRLPAQDIYDLARLVCWNWYRMIYTPNFINANLQCMPYGLIFRCTNGVAFFVTTQQGQIEFSELRLVPNNFWSSCNGLCLEIDNLRQTRIRNTSHLYIVNPVTKQVFALPPTNYGIQAFEACSIGYASASMQYKVVITASCFRDIRVWGILTPGVDSSWRVVRTDHMAMFKSAIPRTPIITEGFMHWTFLPPGLGVARNEVLTLDLETEILTKSCVPVNYPVNEHWSYLSTGRYLSLLITGGGCLWQVWEMKKPGEWRKLDGVVIDLGTRMLQQLKGFAVSPVGWLKYLEVLVFFVVHPHGIQQLKNAFFYNLQTKEIKPFDQLPCAPSIRKPVVHKNSLTWLA